MGLFIRANAFENNDLFSPVLAEFDSAADATAMQCNLTVPDHWWLHDNRTAVSADSVFEIYDLIPEGSTYYNYDGGLTTPPCSEVVEWNVADKPLSISIAQYNDLSSLILNYVAADTCEEGTIASPSGSTSRPVQDLNGRNVSRICPVDFKDPLAEEAATTTSGASLVKAGTLVTTLMAAMALLA
jgi:Eukaryotic-type carbonic anhydrase